ncbi:hypothetical protein OH492_12255 [Vibrio chagasii]|nr:hypothetical protein [Vibrio chagasii]
MRGEEKVKLRSIKGAHETFNLTSPIDMRKTSPDPKWPYYDRNLYDPVDDAITVEKEIVWVIEGGN